MAIRGEQIPLEQQEVLTVAPTAPTHWARRETIRETLGVLIHWAQPVDPMEQHVEPTPLARHVATGNA